MGELGAQVTGGGLCPAGLQNSHQGQALRKLWPSPHPHLCLLMAATIWLGHFLWNLPPSTPSSSLPYGQPRGLRASQSGCLAPSAMTAEQGLRTLPWGCYQRRLALPQQDQTLEGKVIPWDLPFLVRTEDNTCSRFTRICYLTMTWPPERGIWHQDFYNHSSCLSLLSPWKGFCWEFEVFLMQKPPLSLHGLQ